MLLSHSIQEKAFDSFASFIRNVLAGDDRYVPLVQPTILEAVSLAKSEKDYYNISRDSFDVIVFLAEKAANFLKGLDIQNLSQQDYEHLLDLVTRQRDLIIA